MKDLLELQGDDLFEVHLRIGDSLETIKNEKVMGNDSTIWFRRDENDLGIPLFESSSSPCLLWLCCFRLNDFDIVRGFGSYCLASPIERSIVQLDGGVKILEKYFGNIKHLREYKAVLESALNKMGSGYLFMDFADTCYLSPRLLDLIIHSISGFWNPDLKVFYNEKERDEWNMGHAPPLSTGVMTWAGALQRTCIPRYNLQEGYDYEGSQAFDWEIHDCLEPRLYLIGNG